MAALYSGTTVSGYNANPPPDDGTTGANNQITWAGIKSKLGDPLNTFDAAINTNVTSAFNKTLGGGSLVSTSVSYPMSAADQGRLISASTAGITITTPDATSVLNPFCFAVDNPSNGSITLAGNGSQNVDGQNTQTMLSGGGCIVWTDGSNWFTSGLTPAQLNFSLKPQGYLNLANDAQNPIITADATGIGAVYYTPYEGNLVSIFNGTLFKTFTFSQVGVTLVSNHLANTLYDVFVFLNSGAVTFGTGPAWNTSTAGSCARGTGAGTTELQRINGLWTNKNSMTMRNGSTTFAGIVANQATYLGTISIDSAAGAVTCHKSYGQSRKWGVWNAYNRVPLVLKAGDGTASWGYNSATIRQSNAAAGNTLQVLSGLAEEVYNLRFEQNAQTGTAASSVTSTVNNYIGINSTTSPSGRQGKLQTVNTATTTSTQNNGDLVASFIQPPLIGINNFNCLEAGTGTGGVTFIGTEQFMVLSASWRG